MIIDHLDQAGRYYALHPRLERAFDYILTHDLLHCPAGRYEADGDRIYVMLSDIELKRPEDAPIEVHDRYMDIQVVLEGEETYGYTYRPELRAAAGPFDSGRDVQFWRDRPSTLFTLHAGQFCLLLPEDGHAPMIGQGRVRKCIVKVRMD